MIHSSTESLTIYLEKSRENDAQITSWMVQRVVFTLACLLGRGSKVTITRFLLETVQGHSLFCSIFAGKVSIDRQSADDKCPLN